MSAARHAALWSAATDSGVGGRTSFSLAFSAVADVGCLSRSALAAVVAGAGSVWLLPVPAWLGSELVLALAATAPAVCFGKAPARDVYRMHIELRLLRHLPSCRLRRKSVGDWPYGLI